MRQVFVGGCPRSGTTFLGSLLGRHPDGLCVPEAQFKIPILRAANETRGSKRFDDLARLLKNHPKFRVWHMPLPQHPSAQDGDLFNAADFLDWVMQCYGQRVAKGAYRFWIEHDPNNMQYVGVLMDAFPDSKFVHLVRDPRGVAASAMPLSWAPNTAKYAARWWLAKVSFGLAAQLAYPERVTMVRYEDLLNRPEITLKKLCSFLQLDFHATMLQGKGLEVPDYTKQQHALIARGPVASRVSAWRNSLSERDISTIEVLTFDMLRYLGYERATAAVEFKPSLLEALGTELKELGLRKVVNRIKQRKRMAQGIKQS